MTLNEIQYVQDITQFEHASDLSQLPLICSKFDDVLDTVRYRCYR